jgi:cyanophycin synthetase
MNELEQLPYQIVRGPVTVEGFRILHGANYFSGGPIVMFTINLNEYNEVFTNDIPDFYEKLTAMLPSLIEHHCSEGVRGGFFMRLKDGTLLGHVMEHVSIELQDLAGMHVSYGKTRSTLCEGVYHVIFRFRDEIAGSVAGVAALNLVNSILLDLPFDLQNVVDLMVSIREERLLGPTTQSIADAAAERNITWLRLDEYNLIQLGTGKFQQRIRSSLTSATPALALDIIADRCLTLKMLSDAGIPVPQVVQLDLNGKLPEKSGMVLSRFRESVETDKSVFYIPNVSKLPQSETNNTSETLFAHAAGTEIHRFLVIENEIVAVSKVIPPFVVGDGILSVEQLVAKRNTETGREAGDKGSLSFISLGAEELRQLEWLRFAPQSIPEAGEKIYLGATANPTNGSTTETFAGVVHPDTRNAVLRASRMFGLDVAGIDAILSNPADKPADGEGILQVLAAPNFRMHLKPSIGNGIDVATPFVNLLFPEHSVNHVPLVAICGSRGKSTTIAILNQAMKKLVPDAGVLSSHIFSSGPVAFNPKPIIEADDVRLLMRDPSVGIILTEIGIEMINSYGLPYEWADMAAVLNVEPNDTAQLGFHEAEDLAYAKSVVAEQVTENGVVVLNASDLLVKEMAERIEANIVWFCNNETSAAELPPLSTTVFCTDTNIMLRVGSQILPIVGLAELNSKWKTIDGRPFDSVLAALAIAINFPQQADAVLENVLAYLKM